MTKIPKDVNRIINKLTTAGYEVYCAGQCVMASYAGEEPQDWDLYTDCPQDEVRKFFPDGEAIGKQVVRLDDTEEIISDDINVADSLEGIIADIVTMRGKIEDQVRKYDFTAEAIAEHPQKSPVDPYGGRQDIKDLLLKPAGDIQEAFQKAPEKMLKAIRYVSLYGFDLSRGLSESIAQNAVLLQAADKDEILYEFTLIVNGKYAGKALKMVAGLGLLPGIIGEKTAAAAGKRAENDYETLTEHIDETKHIPLRRQALIYLCFDKYYREAVEYLPYEGLDREYLLDAKTLVQDIHFLGTDVAIKGFLNRCGWDKYNFIDKLSKAQAAVFDLSTQKIEGRDHILKIILAEKQPVFAEDLAIDADDIIEAGITDDAERAEYLLHLLPDVVHQKPKYNERKELLKFAAKFNKNKFRAAFRGVKWLR